MIALKHTFLALATAASMAVNASVPKEVPMLKSAVNYLLFLNPDEKPIKDDDGKKKKTVKRDDTTRVLINRSAIVTDNSDESEGDEDNDGIAEVDSLLAFPSGDLYASWDTATIHPYSFSHSFKTDSVNLRLTEPTDCGFVLPFKGSVTSEFGWRHRRPHYGTDIDLETGDKVVAAFDGMVRIAKLNRSYGNVVIIRHKNGLETVYAHLSKILVEAGQTIEAGQEIGLGGNTGHSYGAHLHFEMRFLGQAIDAEDFVDFAKGELKKNDYLITKSDVETKYDLRALHSRHHSDLSGSKYSSSVVKGKKGKAYKVRQGDTITRIAKRNHTSVKAICSKNGFKSTKKLRAGQKIKI